MSASLGAVMLLLMEDVGIMPPVLDITPSLCVCAT
jgi:hypothetical protein